MALREGYFSWMQQAETIDLDVPPYVVDPELPAEFKSQIDRIMHMTRRKIQSWPKTCRMQARRHTLRTQAIS
jgi:hypothetical protein